MSSCQPINSIKKTQSTDPNQWPGIIFSSSSTGLRRLIIIIIIINRICIAVKSEDTEALVASG